jgi:hypothetical protein
MLPIIVISGLFMGASFFDYKLHNDDAFDQSVSASYPSVVNTFKRLRGHKAKEPVLEQIPSAAVNSDSIVVDTSTEQVEQSATVSEVDIAEVSVDPVEANESQESPQEHGQAVVELAVAPVQSIASDSLASSTTVTTDPASHRITITPAGSTGVESNAVAVIDYSQLAAVPAEVRAQNIKHDIATILLDELNEQTAAFKRELEESLLKDLQTLDEHALRLRVAKLASEFFERSKWEGIRLHQSLRQLEHDITRRYLDLLAEQRTQLEAEVRKSLFAKEKEMALEADRAMHSAQGRFELQLREALRAQAEVSEQKVQHELAELQSRLTREFGNQLNATLSQERQNHIETLTSLQSQISGAEADLSVLTGFVESKESLKMLSNSLHKQSSAILALEAALADSRPVAAEVLTLKKLCKGDAFLEVVVASIPAAAERGIPSLPDLRARFKLVQAEVRKHALAPESAPKILGQMVGTALAMASSAPKGYVEGTGLEETLARSAHYLDNGDLRSAVQELKDLHGYAKVMLKDWEAEAGYRLTAEDTVKLLRAGAAARHLALAEK